MVLHRWESIAVRAIDEGLTLETSAFLAFMVANLHFQPSCLHLITCSAMFLSHLNEISGVCKNIVPVYELFRSNLKFLRMIDLTAWL